MTWEVQLTGDPTKLQMLADGFAAGEIQIVQSGKEFVLRSSKFELLNFAARVRESAIELTIVLSSSARLLLGAQGAIRPGAVVYWLRPDGKRDKTVLATTSFSGLVIPRTALLRRVTRRGMV